MALTELALPIDIPWKRMAVSANMISERKKDAVPRWKSSVAIFYHEPTELPPEYCDRRITYLKIVCTITNFDSGNIVGTAPLPTPYQYDELTRSRPCYGALLQVTAYPNPDDDVALHDYPYFSAFEPRKREMYETVTESGEVLSQSANHINLGKQLTDTKSDETYDLDTGSAISVSSGRATSGSAVFGLGSGSSEHSSSFSAEKSGQWGTIERNNRQDQNVRATDSSREKRESFSHSTSLNNIYSLLMGYHLGTNRAMFYLQPRPHIQDTKFTFIQGPRRLEGVQEFFLIVNRAASIPGICVRARLETAHLYSHRAYKPRLIPLSDAYIPGNLNKTAQALGLNVNDFGNYGQLVRAWNNTYPWVRYVVTAATSEPDKWAEARRLRDDLNVPLSELLQVVKRLPDIGAEDVALIFEEYEHDNGIFFVLGQQVEGCATPQGKDGSNVDVEHSSEFHLDKENDEPWLVYEGKYEKSVQSLSDSGKGGYFNNMAGDIQELLVSSVSSPDRLDYGQVRFSESEFVLDDVARLIKETDLDDPQFVKHIGKTINEHQPDILNLFPSGQDVEKLFGPKGKLKQMSDIGGITTRALVDELGLNSVKARKLRSAIFALVLRSLNQNKLKNDTPINPIANRMKRQMPKPRLDELLQSAIAEPPTQAAAKRKAEGKKTDKR